jgi:hypothetical protein
MSGKHIESAVFDQALDAGLLMVSAIGQTSQIEISIRLLDRLNALQCEDASPCELAVCTGLLAALGVGQLGELRQLLCRRASPKLYSDGRAAADDSAVE